MKISDLAEIKLKLISIEEDGKKYSKRWEKLQKLAYKLTNERSIVYESFFTNQESN